MAFKARNYIAENDPYFHSKTALQWRKERRTPNDGAEGRFMYYNGFKQQGAQYFLIEDTHPATPEELAQWQAEKREQARAYRKRRKEVAELERQRQEREEALERQREQVRLERLRRCRVIDKARTICLDVETTGLIPSYDEILQLSIIDGNNNVLFNEYIKPKSLTEWPEAEEINGISPEMVSDKPTIDEYIPRLNEILANAVLIVGYNSDEFDIPFIRFAGITVPNEIPTFDVMLEFAPIYGEWNEYYRDYTWQKLCVCADYYNYKESGSFHDSLEDVRATLHCYYAMLEEADLIE